MPFAFLFAMQAAGVVFDWLGTQQQQMINNLSGKVQQAGMEANIQQLRLQAEDESLQEMKKLRQNMGTQLAVFSARGTKMAGSAFSIFNESIADFNSDERMRKLNLLSNENQTRAGMAISRLQNMSANSKLWQSFGQRSLNKFPSNVAGWNQGIKDFQEGFGLTPAGG